MLLVARIYIPPSITSSTLSLLWCGRSPSSLPHVTLLSVLGPVLVSASAIASVHAPVSVSVPAPVSVSVSAAAVFVSVPAPVPVPVPVHVFVLCSLSRPRSRPRPCLRSRSRCRSPFPAPGAWFSSACVCAHACIILCHFHWSSRGGGSMIFVTKTFNQTKPKGHTFSSVRLFTKF